MKYSAIIAVAAAQDITSLIQLNDCNRAGSVSGVSCEPARELLFATGMNGDEDLGEDITMKGNKFHFIQQQNALAQEDPAKTEKVETLEPEKVQVAGGFGEGDGLVDRPLLVGIDQLSTASMPSVLVLPALVKNWAAPMLLAARTSLMLCGMAGLVAEIAPEMTIRSVMSILK